MPGLYPANNQLRRSRMRRNKWFPMLVMLVVGIGATAFNGLAAEKTLILNPDAQAVQLNLVFNIGAATLKVLQSTDSAYIVKAVVTYSDARLDPGLTQTVNEGILSASFNSGVISGVYPSDTVHDWQITFGAYATPTNLSINLGGVSGGLDFGAMPLKNLNAELGGCELSVDFSTPTQSAVDRILINSGGVWMSLMNIGNTDFNRLILNAGGSMTQLDFAGAYSIGKHLCEIGMGGGYLNLLVPESAGEMLQAATVSAPLWVSGQGWVQEIKRPFFKKYVTNDYDTQNVLIDFNIQAAGSVIYINR